MVSVDTQGRSIWPKVYQSLWHIICSSRTLLLSDSITPVSIHLDLTNLMVRHELKSVMDLQSTNFETSRDHTSNNFSGWVESTALSVCTDFSQSTNVEVVKLNNWSHPRQWNIAYDMNLTMHIDRLFSMEDKVQVRYEAHLADLPSKILKLTHHQSMIKWWNINFPTSTDWSLGNCYPQPTKDLSGIIRWHEANSVFYAWQHRKWLPKRL